MKEKGNVEHPVSVFWGRGEERKGGKRRGGKRRGEEGRGEE